MDRRGKRAGRAPQADVAAAATVGPAWYRLDGRRMVLTIAFHVQPNASRTQLAGEHGGALKLRLAALPIDGRANQALIEFVSDRLGVPRSTVTIEAGTQSRRKAVAVSGCSLPPDALLARLGR